MIEVVVIICLVMLSVAVILALYRLLVGPSILDRIIGFDMVAICIVGMIILVSVEWQSTLFVEIMLIFSLLGFMGSVAYVSFLASNPSRLKDKVRIYKKEDNHGS